MICEECGGSIKIVTPRLSKILLYETRGRRRVDEDELAEASAEELEQAAGATGE